MSDERQTVRERHAQSAYDAPAKSDRSIVLASDAIEREARATRARRPRRWLAIAALCVLIGAPLSVAIVLLPDALRVALIGLGLVVFLVFDTVKRRSDWTHAAVPRGYRRSVRGTLVRRSEHIESEDLWWLPAQSPADLAHMIEIGAELEDPVESGRGTVESWRAFSAAMRGDWPAAERAATEALARNPKLFFARLTLAVIARHRGDHGRAREALSALSSLSVQFAQCDPIRALVVALETEPVGGYRAAPQAASGVLHARWMDAALPMLALPRAPFRAIAHGRASWNVPAIEPPPKLERPSTARELGTEVRAAIEERERERAVAALNSAPESVIDDPASEGVVLRSPEQQERLLWLATKIEHRTIAGSLDKAADAAAQLAREIPAFLREEVSFAQLVAAHQLVMDCYAWAARAKDAEAMLALIEKLGHAAFTGASRFECRFVAAITEGDRARCAALADELPDDVEIDDSVWLTALAIQAITHAPGERARVRARIEADRVCLARLRAVAPWVLDALEAQP
ncbi:MAG: hypothetical protein U0269_13440 [Polyangiales bacterium]